MSEAQSAPDSWRHGDPPTGVRQASWTPTSLQDLPEVRREFRSQVQALEPAFGADGGHRLQDAVAVLDELMSNALRHGRAPVLVEVCTTDHGLLLQVDDQAAEDPPLPTDVRDPSLGGMGLGIVARTTVAHGWTTRNQVKTVWALMPAVTD